MYREAGHLYQPVKATPPGQNFPIKSVLITRFKSNSRVYFSPFFSSMKDSSELNELQSVPNALPICLPVYLQMHTESAHLFIHSFNTLNCNYFYGIAQLAVTDSRLFGIACVLCHYIVAVSTHANLELKMNLKQGLGNASSTSTCNLLQKKPKFD